MKHTAEILDEHVTGSNQVHGVTFDGENVWCATGGELVALDPESGRRERALAVPSDAGTAFDGKHLYQIAGTEILKLDPKSGDVVGRIPAPGKGEDSGMAWAEGSLWVGQYRARKIHQIDPNTGNILRTLESNRFVTGVSWVDGELWHGTLEDERSELRRIDPTSGSVEESVELPPGVAVTGLDSNGSDRFYCGGGTSGKLREVRRPARRAG